MSLYKDEIAGQFRSAHFYHRLNDRKMGFIKAIEHLCSIPGKAMIIETGTARIKDNFEGDGQSTFIWDWLCRRRRDETKVISIDHNHHAIALMKEQTKFVRYICEDSLIGLSNIAEKTIRQTKLLYLDSFDWSAAIQFESSFHALTELMMVWRLLPPDCLIMVDDCKTEVLGKQTMIKLFFEKLHREPEFIGYQTGWLRGF